MQTRLIKWKAKFHKNNIYNFFEQVILRIHEARMRLENLGCFKNVGVFIDTYDGEGAVNDGIEVKFTFFCSYFLYKRKW